jgi:hypothetical protein
MCNFYVLLNELRLAPKCFAYALEAVRDADRREREGSLELDAEVSEPVILGPDDSEWDDLGWHGLQFNDIYPYPNDTQGRSQSARILVNGVIMTLEDLNHIDVTNEIEDLAEENRVQVRD